MLTPPYRIGRWMDATIIHLLIFFTCFPFAVVPTIALTTPINSSNINEAVRRWLYQEEKASVIFGDIRDWNTSTVTDMSSMFLDATSFNGDLSRWDTSAVTDMSGMFYNAKAFKGDLSRWNTSAVTDMKNMLSDASQVSQMPILRYIPFIVGAFAFFL